MSANADVLQSELIGPGAQETTLPWLEPVREANDWNPEDFAREQIRGLVRRGFFLRGSPPGVEGCFCDHGASPCVGHICAQRGGASLLRTAAPTSTSGCERLA